MFKGLQIFVIFFMLSPLLYTACASSSNPPPETIVQTVVVTAPPVTVVEVVTATPLPPMPTLTPVPPTATQAPSPDDLEEDAKKWQVYSENSPTWILENVDEPALSGRSLRCSISGGDPYSNVHCYQNLPADPDANEFTLSLAFWFSPEATCNNLEGISTVQAIEFSMSKWHQEDRYEFALQWENVGDGAPQWRYWVSNEWLPLNSNFKQCLQADRWHTFVLEGKTIDGQVNYQSFTIDDLKYNLDLTVPPVAEPEEEDRLAIAVQLDGNSSQSPYDLFIDEVKFTVTALAPVPTDTPTPANTPTTVPAPEPIVCTEAKITNPVTEVVYKDATTNVEWNLPTCNMNVQFYQNEQLIRENQGGDASGVVNLSEVPPGLTEIKIWEPGSSSPADTIWVTVAEKPGLPPTPVPCSQAKITNPVKYSDKDTVVYKDAPTLVEWSLPVCKLNVQLYQNGVLIRENQGGDASGVVNLSEVPPGLTEIKIWEPGSSSPADMMLVTVQ